MRWLVAAGAAINYVGDFDHSTPLMVAAAGGQLSSLRALTDLGADVTLTNVQGPCVCVCA